MELYAANSTVQMLDAQLPRIDGPARVQCLVALAWHLRQRDSAKALALADEAGSSLGQVPGPAERRALQLRLSLVRCEVAALRSELDAAEQWLAQARAELAEGDPSQAGDTLLAEAVVAKARGQRERELDAYDRGVDVLARGLDPARLAIAGAWAAYERTFGAPADAPAEGRRADDPAVDALYSAARALRLSRREPAVAAELFLQASEQAQRVGLVRHAVVCTINAGTAMQGLGEFEQAAACFERAEAVARATSWPALHGSVQTKLGAYLAELGRLDEARERLAQAVLSFAATPASINRANACSELAITLMRLGRGVEAVEPMNEAIQVYRQTQSTDNLALNLIHQAALLSSVAQPKAALAAMAQAQALIDQHGLTALQVGVHETLARIHREHRQLPLPADLHGAPTAALYHAEAALREGRALAGWRAPSAMLVALADDWAAAGDMARAFGHAREALRVMAHEAARLRAQSIELRPPPQPTTAAAARFLTPKEFEVLRLLARNYSNKEIAIALALGDETVKWHLKNIFAKLGVGSRRHAVARARALGVLAHDA